MRLPPTEYPYVSLPLYRVRLCIRFACNALVLVSDTLVARSGVIAWLGGIMNASIQRALTSAGIGAFSGLAAGFVLADDRFMNVGEQGFDASKIAAGVAAGTGLLTLSLRPAWAWRAPAVLSRHLAQIPIGATAFAGAAAAGTGLGVLLSSKAPGGQPENDTAEGVAQIRGDIDRLSGHRDEVTDDIARAWKRDGIGAKGTVGEGRLDLSGLLTPTAVAHIFEAYGDTKYLRWDATRNYGSFNSFGMGKLLSKAEGQQSTEVVDRHQVLNVVERVIDTDGDHRISEDEAIAFQLGPYREVRFSQAQDAASEENR